MEFFSFLCVCYIILHISLICSMFSRCVLSRSVERRAFAEKRGVQVA